MSVDPLSTPIEFLTMARTTPAETTSRGTWVAVGVAAALLLGRVVLWLLVRLLLFLTLLAIVGMILAIGFALGSHWDGVAGAAACSAEVSAVVPGHR